MVWSLIPVLIAGAIHVYQFNAGYYCPIAISFWFSATCVADAVQAL
jgi:hypothetical protein